MSRFEEERLRHEHKRIEPGPARFLAMVIAEENYERFRCPDGLKI
jgi:hypothetical protein